MSTTSSTTTFTTTTSSSSSTASTTSTSSSTTSTTTTTTSTHSTSTTTTTAPNTGFCLFRDVTIPYNSRILKAVVEFTGYAPTDGIDTDVQCHFEDADDPSAPADKADLDTRELTSGVPWKNIEEWKDNYDYQTPQLRDILQTVVNRSGWTSGNNILFTAKNDGLDSYRLWSAIEHRGGLERARLKVSWIAPKKLDPPVITPAETFQLLPFDCSIRAFPTDANIYYTLDGTNPNDHDILYTGPFEISSTKIVKARAYKDYWAYSDYAQKDYTLLFAGIGTHRHMIDDDYVINIPTIQQTYGGKVYIAVNRFATLELIEWDPVLGVDTAHVISGTDLGDGRAIIDYFIDSSGVHHVLWGSYTYSGGYVYALNFTSGSPTTSWSTSQVATPNYYVSYGRILITILGEKHVFWSDMIAVGSYTYHLYHSRYVGSWESELMEYYTYTPRSLSAVIRTDDTFVIIKRSGSSSYKIYEGSWGSWSGTTGVAIPYTGVYSKPGISIYNAVAGRDDTTFLYLYDHNLYKVSNVSGSWAIDLVADASTVDRPFGVYGFVVDSNGYWHISFSHYPVAGNQKIGYGTNDEGSWSFFDAHNPLHSTEQEQLSQRGITYLEANEEVYITYRIATGGDTQGVWLITIDK